MKGITAGPSGVGRRTYLRAIGTAGVVVGLTGCTGAGNGDSPDGGGGAESGGSSGDGSGGVPTGEPSDRIETDSPFDCTDLTSGSQVFDPDGRAFQVVWDYPETFSDVEREMANTDSLVGARLGHEASKQPGSWAFVLQLMQGLNPITAEAAERHVNNPVFEAADPIEYEGQTLERSTSGGGTNRSWNVAIPGDEDGEFFTMKVILASENEDEFEGCTAVAASVAEGIMQSFRPNPAR